MANDDEGEVTGNDSLLRTYLSGGRPWALQIGSGSHNKLGWLNSDLTRHTSETFILDAKRTFPLESNTFDYVYAEHMIEHIEYHEGCAMMRECFRVLRPGGVARIVTPSIDFLIGLFSPDRTALQSSYIEWSVRSFIHPDLTPMPASVFNTFVRTWGHRFIYDGQSLRRAFTEAGFPEPTECRIGESDHEFLAGLENVQRLPPGFLELESMLMEGRKP